MARILITGATGCLGRAAALRFLALGWQVRCLVRNPDKAADLADAGAEVIRRDLTDIGTLDGACGQVDVLLTAAHAILGRGRNSSYRVDNLGHRRLINAAAENRVGHFIYTSLHQAAPDHPIDFFRTKYAVQQYLQQSGLNYTVLRLPAFMEWHVHNLLGKAIVEKGKAVLFGKGDRPINFVAVGDIVQGLSIIAGNKAYHNREVRIAGPENLTRAEIVAAYGHALQLTPAIRHVPIGMVKMFSGIAGLFHPGIGRVMKMAVKEGRTDHTMDPADSIRQFGLEPTTVEAFIRSQVPFTAGRPLQERQTPPY